MIPSVPVTRGPAGEARPAEAREKIERSDVVYMF
jgi:hypothetical protein